MMVARVLRRTETSPDFAESTRTPGRPSAVPAFLLNYFPEKTEGDRAWLERKWTVGATRASRAGTT